MSGIKPGSGFSAVTVRDVRRSVHRRAPSGYAEGPAGVTPAGPPVVRFRIGRTRSVRASGGGGRRRPVLPQAPVAEKGVGGHARPAHDGPGATLWGSPLFRSRWYGSLMSGAHLPDGSTAMYRTSLGRRLPPPMWRPSFRVPLSRGRGPRRAGRRSAGERSESRR